MQAKKENPFLAFVGRDPAPAVLPPPRDWRQLEDADPSVVSTVRHQLAIRARKLFEEENSDAKP